MAGTIKHSWNGTVLTIESDSGISSADLKGAKGDTGIRGAQGVMDYTRLTTTATNAAFEAADSSYSANVNITIKDDLRIASFLLGSVTVEANTPLVIGTLADSCKPKYEINTSGYIGASSVIGTAVRLCIGTDGTVTIYSSTAATGTLRASTAYIIS